LLNSEHGGTWTPSGGTHKFDESEASAWLAANEKKLREGGGGAYNGGVSLDLTGVEPGQYKSTIQGKDGRNYNVNLIVHSNGSVSILSIGLAGSPGIRFGITLLSEAVVNGAQQGLSFEKLWDAYGDGISHVDKDGAEIFSDYCAINLSESLIANGLSPGGTKCWGTCSTNKKHTIRAQELADWLSTNLSGAVVLKGEEFLDYIDGKTGIVFFQNYWKREGEETPTGDHIDLWDGNEMGSYGAVRTWIRTTMPWVGESMGMSDLEKSTKILFWEIK
jgi:hypothetical protein